MTAIAGTHAARVGCRRACSGRDAAWTLGAQVDCARRWAWRRGDGVACTM